MAVGNRIPLIADGGIKRDGAIIEALLFGGDTVMLGKPLRHGRDLARPCTSLSSCPNLKSGACPFKVFRGMASIGAMVDRLDVEDADSVDVDTLGAEGLEVSVPLRGSARPIIAGMLKHLSSSISYGGAAGLAELKKLFWERPDDYIIRLSDASRRESFDR